jgi:drug/metabolite transporter superfamily protein YnfA
MPWQQVIGELAAFAVLVAIIAGAWLLSRWVKRRASPLMREIAIMALALLVIRGLFALFPWPLALLTSLIAGACVCGDLLKRRGVLRGK